MDSLINKSNLEGEGTCPLKEIWKAIPGYEGKYEASTLGRIRSVDRIVYSRNWHTGISFKRIIKGKILHPGRYCKSGHLSVVLGHNAKGSPVHQLIMRTFVGDCPKGYEVLHKNGNPEDNRLINLHYGTRTENILDVYRQGKVWRKLSIDDVEAIRFGLSCGYMLKELASLYNVSISLISQIKNGVHYSWLK